MTINILPLVLMYVLLARLVERFGTTDWGRIFVMAAATLGTLLTTFAVVLNNHMLAAVSAAVTLYAVRANLGRRRAATGGTSRWPGLPRPSRPPTNCRPCRCWPSSGLLLLWQAPRQTLLAFAPAVADRGRRVLRHQLDRPRQPAAALHAPQRDRSERQLVRLHLHGQRPRDAKLLARSARASIAASQSKLDVCRSHVLVGHHGIFSLTPVWLLSVAGHVALAAFGRSSAPRSGGRDWWR